MTLKNGKNFYFVLLVIFFVGFVLTGYKPEAGYGIWALESFPAVLALVVLAATVKKFEFSKTVYVLILLHSFILMHGGHTTYAEEPIFDFFKEYFGLARNYYDRLGHFAQGFVPAVAALEYFVARNIVPKPKWRNFLIVTMLLGLAAFYEFIEWWVALLSSDTGNTFLGTQGDIWDTQWDMFMCMVGTVCALLVFRMLKKRIFKTGQADE